MKNLIIVFSIFTSILCKAQESRQIGQTPVYQFGQLNPNQEGAFVFANICNVRKEDNVNSELIGKLKAGTYLSINKISSKTYTANGITAPWIKVSNDTLNGFVWGGNLTYGKLDLNHNTFVIWGLLSAKSDSSEAYASIRIISNNEIISRKDFPVVYGDNPDEGYLTLYPSPLIDEVENLIVFETLSEACGVYSSSHYFLYNKNTLHFIGSGYSMGDGGVLHTSREYILPYPESENQDFHYNPEQGHIFLIENDGSYDDNCIWIETRKVSDFIWEENRLKATCEY